MQPHRGSTLVLAASVIVAAIAVDVLLSACDTAPTGPTPLRIEVTITAGGVSPDLASGASVIVEFVNQDTEPHDIRSNPHPQHTDCTQLNVGVIIPGRRTIIPVIAGTRSCGYHDETRPDDRRFQGFVTTQ